MDKKHKYEKPQMKVYVIKSPTLLAGSPGVFGSSGFGMGYGGVDEDGTAGVN